MSISVIIPLFNKAPFIQEVLVGFIGQLFPNDEVIVIDDCSTDSGPQIVESLATSQVSLIKLNKNCGPAAARNLGAAHASGKYLLFFDADDIPHSELISSLRYAIEVYPNEVMWSYDIAFEAHGEIVDKGALLNSSRPSIELLGVHAFVNSSLNGKRVCTASSTCVRSDIFANSGGFKEELRYCEDPELWARLSAKHSLVHIIKTLATYRDVPKSLSHELRTIPKAAHPYILTLFKLSLCGGIEYLYLARLMIKKNILFSAAYNKDRKTLLNYLREVAHLLTPLQLVLCRIILVSPSQIIYLLLILRLKLMKLHQNIRIKNL